MRRFHACPRFKSKIDNAGDRAMDPAVIRSFSTTRSSKSNARSLSTASILTLFALASCYYFTKSHNPYQGYKYGLIIDCGSSGTRVYILRYSIENWKPRYEFDVGTMKVNPGLSAYIGDPLGAAESLMKLVAYAKDKVPRDVWMETEIRLMATAGLRMLDASIRERLLDSCRSVLRTSGFKFKHEWASVVTGSDEGIYAWIIANYALGTLGGNPLQTAGIIELGGASTQVTFVAEELIPSKFLRTVKLEGVTYNVYSHSYLQFGQDAASLVLRESLVSESSHGIYAEKEVVFDPCTPTGYPHYTSSLNLSQNLIANKSRALHSIKPRGNFTQCRHAATMLLQKGKENCSHKNCYVGSTYMPKFRGVFIATENFFYTSEFFGLSGRTFLRDLMVAGEQFCGEDWSTLRQKHRLHSDEDLVRYCFSSAYIVALLHDSLGVSLDDESIMITNKIGTVSLDWALGSFILQSTLDLEAMKHREQMLTDSHYNIYPRHVLLGILFMLLIIYCLCRFKKPQTRTIYDLEKGKYLITRRS